MRFCPILIAVIVGLSCIFVSLCYKCKPCNQLPVGQSFCLLCCWSSALVLIPPQEGKRSQKRDSRGSRLPPRTKGPCGPPLHPSPAVASHSPRTPFHTLTTSSQVDIKLFIVVCWGFWCYTYLVLWNVTLRLGILILGRQLRLIRHSQLGLQHFGCHFSLIWSPSSASSLPSFPLELVSKLQVVVPAAP